MKKCLFGFISLLLCIATFSQAPKRIIDLPVETALDDTDLAFVGHAADGRLQQTTIGALIAKAIDSVNALGLGGNQSLQQTFDVGSDQDRDDTIHSKGFNFSVDSVPQFSISGGDRAAKIYVPFVIDSLNVNTPAKIAVWDNDTLKSADIEKSFWKTQLSCSTGGIGAISDSTFTQATGRATGVLTTEGTVTFVVQENCKAKNLTIRLGAVGQPVTGTLTVMLRVNQANSVLTFDVPAGASANTVWQNTTNQVSLSAGDLIDYEVINNASSSSAGFYAIGVTLIGQ